jgi:hypothetical protein
MWLSGSLMQVLKVVGFRGLGLKGSGGLGGVSGIGVLRCAQDDGKNKNKCNSGSPACGEG